MSATIATALAVAGMPALGFGALAALTAPPGAAHPYRGPVAIAVGWWVVLGAYLTYVFGA